LSNRTEIDPWSITLTASDLYVIPQFAAFLGADGVLRIPAGHQGHVLYGPYLNLAAGHYLLTLDVDGEADGLIDVYAGGRVFVERPLTSPAPIWLDARDATEGLEFRLSVSGGALVFRSLTLSTTDLSDAQLGQATSVTPVPPSAAANSKLLDDLWSAAHGRAREAVTQLADAARTVDPTVWFEALPRPTVIDVSCEAALQNSFRALRELGFDIAAVRSAAADTFSTEAAFADRVGLTGLADDLRRNLDFPESDLEHHLARLGHIHGAAQFTGLAEGVALCACPFTGAILTSRHAVPVASEDTKQCHIFHYFDGGTPFYLAVAGFAGRKTFLYVPSLTLILQLGPPQFDWGDHKFPVDLLHRMVVDNATAYFDYLAGPTEPALLSGTLNNLGHYFWNDLSGLVRYAPTGLLRNVKKVVGYKYGFLDPECCLDDGVEREFFRLTDKHELFRTFLTHRLYCVRPTALRMPADTASKIRLFAETKLNDAHRARVAQARTADLVIWFNLRAHNKVWREQVDAAVLLAERATREGRSLALVLDGMADCEPLAAEIGRRAPAAVKVFNAFDLPFPESISWAFASDAYIATIGSGLTLVTWVAGRPGVAHSETAHLSQMEFWGDVRGDVPAPVAPPIDAIHDHGHGTYCDYSIDPGLIVDLLWPQLVGLHETRIP
jgi:hypothetical protein